MHIAEVRKELRELVGSEKIIWSAKPKKEAFIFKGFAGLIPGLFILGFAFFWETLAFKAGAPIPILLFGGLFMLIGFLITLGSPIYAALVYKNILYLMTDTRLIIQKGVVGIDYDIVRLSEIQNVNVNVGLIDKIFGTGTHMVYTAAYTRPLILRAIENPYENCRILREAVEKAVKSKET